MWLALLLIVGSVVLVKLQQYALLGNALRVQENQLPKLYNALLDYAQILDTPRVNMYVVQDPYPNAYTFGYPTASVVLTSAIVENLSDAEINFVIAHELGHVKAKHNIVSMFISPIGSGLTTYWNYIFMFWQRKAEYTSDRCGLILTRDIDSAITTMLKISAGLKIADYINTEAYRKQLVTASSGTATIGELIQNHPYITSRIRELVVFKKEYFIKVSKGIPIYKDDI